MKYFVKKLIYFIAIIAFALQQTVSFSPAFAMDPDDLSPIESSKSKSKKPRKSRSKKTPLPAFSLNYLKTLKQEDLEKDLEQRRFKTIAEEDQRALFELMKGRQLRNLVLREASALQNRFFFKKAQLKYLLTLNLEGDVSLTDKIVPLIAEKAPSLESLTLARISNMEEIGKQRKGLFDESPLYIFFPSLRYLDISYGGVNTVLIQAPKLEVFKARAVKALQILDINPPNKTSQHKTETASSALRKIDLREVQSLPLKTFVQLLQNHPELKLQAEALRQLPPVPYKEIKLPLEEENLKRFTEQYQRATEAHDPQAQYRVGVMYTKGQGVKKNTEKAMEWYGRVFEEFKNMAQQGQAIAQYRLAGMYAKGQGVEQNFEIALEWYRKAAEKGHTKAQFLIETYERFLKGRLIYKPNKDDVGKIELRIADLPNPLEGKFDLSACGDAGEYMSIYTGFHKAKRPENPGKAEIWFAPYFLIKNNLQGSASHFEEVMFWNPRVAPVGTFFTMGMEPPSALAQYMFPGTDFSKIHATYFDYASLSWDGYNNVKNNLYKIHSSSYDNAHTFAREATHSCWFTNKRYPKKFYLVFD